MSVNHKRVKQLIAEKRRTITDRQFFTSRILAGHFVDMAVAQTRRYGHSRPVKVRIVWERANDNVACTNNSVVWINAGHTSVTKHRKREPRYNLVCGLFAHELGHILYTDFLAPQTWLHKLAAGQWYPEKPLLRDFTEHRHEADLWDFCDKEELHQKIFLRIAHALHNILEDGHIDNTMVTQYPGVLGQNLRRYNQEMFAEAPTLTQLMEAEDADEDRIWLSITSLMLSYLLSGELKYGDEPMADERVQVIFDLLPELDEALLNPSSKERLNIANTILVRCWPYIKGYIEFCVEKGKLPGAGDPADLAASAMPSASASAEGDTTPVPEPSEEPRLGNSGKRAETAATASAGGGDGGSPAETDELSEPIGGTTEYDDDYAGAGNDHAAADIERLLDDVAEENVHAELEDARTKELNELAKSLRYGNIHEGVNFRVHRMRTVGDDLREQYEAVAPELLRISKALQRSVLQHLKDQRRGGKQTGLLMGRRLDTHALPRNDGRVFYKNALPTEAPQLAVALLIDESGSMYCNDRIAFARAAAIILHDFCRALGIPVMVYGHSTHDSGVDLYSYSEFDAIDRDDCCRLMDVSARNSNRDGAALQFVAEQLSRRTEDVKLLMLISDGQPADDGYYGTAAEEDLRGIQHEYQRKRVLFIAASIGDDRENLQRIYGDSYMDISDLNQLPMRLTGVVKRHIRV